MEVFWKAVEPSGHRAELEEVRDGDGGSSGSHLRSVFRPAKSVEAELRAPASPNTLPTSNSLKLNHINPSSLRLLLLKQSGYYFGGKKGSLC